MHLMHGWEDLEVTPWRHQAVQITVAPHCIGKGVTCWGQLVSGYVNSLQAHSATWRS